MCYFYCFAEILLGELAKKNNIEFGQEDFNNFKVTSQNQRNGTTLKFNNISAENQSGTKVEIEITSPLEEDVDTTKVMTLQ